MKRTFSENSLLRLALFAVLAACACGPAVNRAKAAPGNAASSAAPAVAPSVNAPFLDPHLDPQVWVERFEHEGREVYDKRAQIIGALQLRPGEDVADIGAGTGLFTLLMAEKVGPAGIVYAEDIAPKFLEFIRRRSAAEGLRNVKPVLGGEYAAPLPAPVDLAFICDVYHHFDYPNEMLASIRRALRPGGRLVLVDFKRVPGQSSAWILRHVRAGEAVFTSEIERAGFKKISEPDFLKETYMVIFQKTGPSRR